jgi:hypothetical protein
MESNWRYIDGVSLFNEMLHGWSLLHEILATCNIVLNIIINISFYLFQHPSSNLQVVIYTTYVPSKLYNSAQQLSSDLDQYNRFD